ncbi:MAG: indole-3-glycerol-phosphate synthase [Deferribacterales bacterium]
MHSKLLEIVNYKKSEIKALPYISLTRKKAILNPLKSLADKPFIAEFKKASPSAGIIDNSKDLKEQLEGYETYGAGMVSILTDEKFFGGSFENLQKASEILKIPILCKEFIISEIQIDYAYHHGADTILLIAAILDNPTLVKLLEYAKKLGLFTLLEIHTEDEYLRVKDLPFNMIGINSRNLNTFEINKENAIKLISNIDNGIFKVAESGIESYKDIKRFKKAGANAFLVGTYFMKHNNLKDAFHELYRGLNDVC